MTAPITVPVIRPTPPESDTPPMTDAAMASSSKPTPTPAWPLIARAVWTIAAEAREQAGDRVDEDDVALDVDAGDARRERIGADGVGEFAVARVAQRDVEDERDAEEDDDRPPAGADRGVGILERLPIGSPFVYQSATPRADTIMPSVAMNGGILV